MLEPSITTLIAYLTVVSLIIGMVSWLSAQFKETRKLVYDKYEELRTLFLTKLELHEKNDELRFQDMTNDIWKIKVRNAARDGLIDLNGTKKD